ncbi:hypothetical protein [uncultured Veillonella sp.]|uniref:hypothetical protein n=1 Tax=uncultured Veillonella sp. TaxID=159268 RepID=UPI00263482E6|nr:hypothetical protein [uncultured Veillonella sp.]
MNHFFTQFEKPLHEAGAARYEWAKKQVTVALNQDMSTAEAKALFQHLMALDMNGINESGNDEVHATFRRAIGQATTALEEGQSTALALYLFRCIMHGDLKDKE